MGDARGRDFQVQSDVFGRAADTVIQPIDAPRNAPAITSESQCPLVITTALQMSTASHTLGSRKRGMTSQTVAAMAADMVAVPDGNESQWGPPCRNLNS